MALVQINTDNATTTAADADEDAPIDIRKVREREPWWPFSADTTYRLVRKGTLGAIAIGRRRMVTRRLLRECLARCTTVSAGDQ